MQRHPQSIAALVMMTIALLCSASAQAAAGDFGPTFRTSGKVLTDFGSSKDVAVATASQSSLDEIYAALRPENLRTTTGGTAFSQGDSLEFLLDLVNTSDQPLVIPLTDYFGSSFHLVGTQQAWIERLGPDPTIPSIPPIIARKGTWYASGGEIIAVEGLPGNTISPGGRITRQASLLYSTAGFPSGRYRFHVEYKPLFGGLFDVIAEVSLDLTIGAVDETPPVITVPVGITVDATAPDGATVSYSASATDDVDGPVPVTCAPLSGSAFPIGDTTVDCTAMDAAENVASASFKVHVRSADEQVAQLIALVDSYGLSKLGASLHDKLVTVKRFLTAGKPQQAEDNLNVFIAQVDAQRGKGLTNEQADALKTAAQRILDVIVT